MTGYGHDALYALYRLTQESVSGDPNGKNGTVSYAYDNVGNRQRMNSTLGAVPAGEGDQVFHLCPPESEQRTTSDIPSCVLYPT